MIFFMKWRVSEDLSLLEALAQKFPDNSKTSLRSWLKEDRVAVDEAIIKAADYVVKNGQTISVGSRKRILEKGMTLIFEDSHIVAIDKPAGLLSVATAFEEKDTAHALLKAHYHPRRVYVVHRIDQETSGVMLFALSDEAYKVLKEMFERHDLERAYTAIVEGQPSTSSGTWKSYLHEDPNYHVHQSDGPEQGGRLAITHYTVQAKSKRYSALQLKLETGRKNQIRVHCQGAGHPIVGDKKYGARTDPLKRLCLHAHLLALRHPITGKEMRFESPVPASFHSLLEKHP